MTLKETAITEWRAHLSQSLGQLERGTEAARSGTRVDGEHRPSNRGERGAVTTAGYLAQGLAERAESLREHLENLDAMGAGPRDGAVIGALIELSLNGAPPERIALFPGGDATRLSCGVQVLSAQSPLAVQLQDAEPGDFVDLQLGPREVEVEVVSIE